MRCHVLREEKNDKACSVTRKLAHFRTSSKKAGPFFNYILWQMKNWNDSAAENHLDISEKVGPSFRSPRSSLPTCRSFCRTVVNVKPTLYQAFSHRVDKKEASNPYTKRILCMSWPLLLLHIIFDIHQKVVVFGFYHRDTMACKSAQLTVLIANKGCWMLLVIELVDGTQLSIAWYSCKQIIWRDVGTGTHRLKLCNLLLIVKRCDRVVERCRRIVRVVFWSQICSLRTMMGLKHMMICDVFISTCSVFGLWLPEGILRVHRATSVRIRIARLVRVHCKERHGIMKE